MKQKMSLGIKISILTCIFLIITSIVLNICANYGLDTLGKKMLGEQALSILNATIVNINTEEFERLVKANTNEDTYYEKLRIYLDEVRRATGCKYLYTIVLQDNKKDVRYIVDGNDTTSSEFSDYNKIESISTFPQHLETVFFSGNTLISDIYSTTEWGDLISAFIPIKTFDNRIVGALACDYTAAAVKERNSALKRFIIIANFIIVFTLICISLFVLNRMFKPLREFAILFKKGATGDLSVRTNFNTNDEIGEMSTAYNDFMNILSIFCNKMKLIAEDKLFDKSLDEDMPGDFKEIKNTIVKNLRELAEQAQIIASDDLYNQKLKTDASGALSKSFADMIKNLRTLTDSAVIIARDDLTNSKLDNIQAGALGSAFKEMINNLRNFAELANLIALGQLSDNRLNLKNNGGALNSAFYNMIVNLKKLAAQANAIAEGKLTAGILNEKIPGELGSAFSIMTEQLRKLINKLENMLAEIKNVSVDIEGCSKIVDQTTEDFIESSKKQEVLAEDTSTAFNELSISINNVSDQSAKNKENADKTGSLAEQGYALINKVSQQMESINDSIKATASKLQELNESSRKIVNIVDIITSISEKTALLALNAAIEAARAGEAGRGFAVVADEVNKLAEQTHKSVKEISMLVDTIKLQTEMSVESMNKGLSLVSSGVEIVEQASNSFKEISNAINESNNSIANITDSINEQSKVIAQISKTTDKLKNISKEISAKSLNLQEKGKTLRTNANKLFEILKNK